MRTIVDLWRANKIDLAVVAASASEKQRGGSYFENYAAFAARLERVGLQDCQHLLPIGRWDISFCGHCLWPEPESKQRETQVWEVLFPNEPIEWVDFANTKDADPADTGSRSYHNWRNKQLDVQMFWAHDHNSRVFFLTADRNFEKRLADSPLFPDAVILTPREAVSRLASPAKGKFR